MPEWQSSIGGVHQKFITSENTSDSNSYVVFPNPVSDILTIQYHEKPSYEGNFRLFNIFGKLLHSMKMNDSGASTLDLESLSIVDGMYILLIEDSKKNIIETKRVLVSRNK